MHDDVELIITFSNQTFFTLSLWSRDWKSFLFFGFRLHSESPKNVHKICFISLYGSSHIASVIIELQFSSLLCCYFHISYFLARILFFSLHSWIYLSFQLICNCFLGLCFLFCWRVITAVSQIFFLFFHQLIFIRKILVFFGKAFKRMIKFNAKFFQDYSRAEFMVSSCFRFASQWATKNVESWFSTWSTFLSARRFSQRNRLYYLWFSLRALFFLYFKAKRASDSLFSMQLEGIFHSVALHTLLKTSKEK